MKITIEAAVKIAKIELENKFGVKFNDLVKSVKSKATFQCGCLYNEFRVNSQVKLFYTGNDNFANGRRNGYGAGIYLSISAINLRKDILIKR